MAKSTNNVLTYGLSGKVGDLLVFRQVDGKTIVSKVPEQPKTVSEKQKEHRKRFQQAIIYAKAAVEAPETGAQYKTAAKKEKQPCNVAVADFFHAPDIQLIDLRGYAGNAGDKIMITVTDDFAVHAVQVRINNADGSLVEEGNAVRSAGDIWMYTATQNNENLEGDKIVVTASDLPGNITQEEQEVES
jgi:signal peptidase I